MLAELTAIRDALRTFYAGKVTVGIGDMTGSAAPFVSVWGPPGDRPDEESMGGPCGSYGGRVGVTFTAARTDAALKMAADGIRVLTPDLMLGSVPVAGRHVQLEYVEARPAQIDRGVTLPGSNTYPAYVVALFDVDSQPA